MRIAIYGRPNSGDVSIEAVNTLVKKLTSEGVEIIFYDAFYKSISKKIKISSPQTFSSHNEINKRADLLFSIGGDGTLLETVCYIRDSGIPVMGINTGRLGFIPAVSVDEIEKVVDAVLKKTYSLDKRFLLELKMKGNYFSDCRYALNDITVQKTDSSSMVTIHASINSNFLNSYWADGLIVSTPTGSTAYSMSCGGPIVMPNSDNFILTPIAPHNLSMRPVVISSNDTVKLEIESRNPNYLISLDSKSESVPSSIALEIKKADFAISLAKLQGHDFLSTLRNKLSWGIDKRN